MNPYETFDARAFWKPAVGTRDALQISDLWEPRITLGPEDTVITSGSCFAQHIGRALQKNGFNWFDAEPGPVLGAPEINRDFGYGVFSFRTGNVYTVALLRQWITWALDPATQSEEVWIEDGGVFDPQRPAIEPGGFSSVAEHRIAREVTLAAIRTAIAQAKVFVFTMGLTEGWVNAETGLCYAMCPGTLAGTFDPVRHVFVNYRHGEILEDLRWTIAAIRTVNPDLQVLLTVSPVPLTATASGNHVLSATVHSKSTLRSVAGELREEFAFVDYFPSYEIISSHPYRGQFFMPNQRQVSEQGVAHVMSHFFAGLGYTNVGPAPDASEPDKRSPGGTGAPQAADDVKCEEAVLDAFGR